MTDTLDEEEEENAGNGAAEAPPEIENSTEGGAEAVAILINGSVDPDEEVEIFPENVVHVATVSTILQQETVEEIQARLDAEWKAYKGEDFFDLEKFLKEHNGGA